MDKEHRETQPFDLEWENSNCTWCNGHNSELLFEGPDRLLHLPGTFQVVRCSNCSLIRQDPRLKWDSLQHYYPDSYPSYYSPSVEATTLISRMINQYGMWKRLRAIERYQSSGLLLDVGCGTGDFLDQAHRSAHWNAAGVEPSSRANLIARERLPFPIFHGSLEDYDPDPDTFDVVTLWNVLEHLPHPADDLRHIFQMMKVGGLLVISIPNLESPGAGLFKTRWLGWDLPRHLYFFPRDLLVDVLHSIGFRVIDFKCIAGSHAAFGHTLDFWSQDWMGANQRLRRTMLNIYNSIPFRLLMSLPFWVLAQLRLSSNITLFAQKANEYENAGNLSETML